MKEDGLPVSSSTVQFCVRVALVPRKSDIVQHDIAYPASLHLPRRVYILAGILLVLRSRSPPDTVGKCWVTFHYSGFAWIRVHTCCLAFPAFSKIPPPERCYFYQCLVYLRSCWMHQHFVPVTLPSVAQIWLALYLIPYYCSLASVVTPFCISTYHVTSPRVYIIYGGENSRALLGRQGFAPLFPPPRALKLLPVGTISFFNCTFEAGVPFALLTAGIGSCLV